MPQVSGLNLLFDADDTLWSNAVHFERALDNWIDLVCSRGAREEDALNLFRELESRGFRRGWFGSRRLEINMRAAAGRLLDREKALSTHEEIGRIVDAVRGPDVLIFDGVHDTLVRLQDDHNLILVTMGEASEQLDKLEASGLRDHFSAVHVLADKTRHRYEAIVRQHRMERRDSWMIGNSMAKDIKPARAAGLKTCYLANGHDFSFGIQTSGIEADLVISRFPDLERHFADRDQR